MKRKLLRLTVLLSALIVLPFVGLQHVAAAPTYTVTMSLPSGWVSGGTITSNPAGINCTSTCSATFDAGTSVTLTATSNSGFRFAYFAGDFNCSSASCTKTVNSDMVAKPVWDYTSINFHVSKTGTGSGTVTSDTGGINCGGTCHATVTTVAYPSTSVATFTATPASDSTFAGWQTSGDLCYTGGGKGGPLAPGTNPTCTASYNSLIKDYTVVPKFDKISTSAPTSTTTPKPSTTTPTTPTSAPTTPTAPSAPQSPTLTETKVGSSAVDTQTPLTISESKPLVLSGRTVANGTVTLTIHSTPRTVTVKADAEGNWSYTITDLEPGDHYVEASVTDPVTSQTSPVTKLTSFTVLASAAPKATTAATNADKKQSSAVIWIVAGITLLAALAAAGWFIWKKRQTHVPPQLPPQPPLQ